MSSLTKNVVWLTTLIVSAASFAYGATLTGTVKGPDGVPFRGAFVQARNTTSKITTSVLSGKDGRYKVPNLPAGEYQLKIKAVGYKANPRNGIVLTADQNATFDLALEKGTVHWNDLSIYQGRQLLPDAKGKELFFGGQGETAGVCFACHDFQTRMASVRRDEAGWRGTVDYMRHDAVGYWLGWRLSDQDAEKATSYLNSVFGEDSTLPPSPANLPKYKETVRSFSDEALDIVYVDYELPGPNRMPWSAAPAKDGTLWIPYYGRANKVGHLDPRTGTVEEFPVPFQGPAGIHSAVAGPDGTVWIGEQGANSLGRLDPQTKQVTEYQDKYLPGKEGITAGGQKHTVRIDSKLNVWASGSPLTRFDPESHKFTRFEEIPTSYGIALDKDENAWFTEMTKNGKLGKIDAKTGKVTKYAPTVDAENFFPHRIMFDSKGFVWVTARGNKIDRFDPKSGSFKEFNLPGPDATNYAIGVDKSDAIWYSASNLDEIGRLDPNSGQVTEYPFLYSEITMREFFLDPQGRMWWASPANNKVGYFYLAAGERTPGSN